MYNSLCHLIHHSSMHVRVAFRWVHLTMVINIQSELHLPASPRHI